MKKEDNERIKYIFTKTNYHNTFKFYIPRFVKSFRILFPKCIKSIHSYANGRQIDKIYNRNEFYQKAIK